MHHLIEKYTSRLYKIIVDFKAESTLQDIISKYIPFGTPMDLDIFRRLHVTLDKGSASTGK